MLTRNKMPLKAVSEIPEETVSVLRLHLGMSIACIISLILCS